MTETLCTRGRERENNERGLAPRTVMLLSLHWRSRFTSVNALCFSTRLHNRCIINREEKAKAETCRRLINRLLVRQSRQSAETMHAERTQTPESHRTFHLGFIIRYNLLILLEFRRCHRSSGFRVRPYDSLLGPGWWSPTCNAAALFSVFLFSLL